MPSPFPGMDPWLESADIWPDLHDSFASEIRAYLNQTLPPPYYARLEMRPEIGVVDDDNGAVYRRAIVPDVSVVDANRVVEVAGAGLAVAGPRTEISPYIEVIVPDELARHLSVEVRDSRRGHRLVTFIEVLSPANKTPGPDRRSYLKKHQEVFESDASLIEIDLLRAGQRTLPNLHLEDEIANQRPRADYLVLVNTGWSRLSGPGAWRLFPVSLRTVLPVVPVPLREGEPEVPLDLQHVFRRAYDSGPYRRGAIDYSGPAHPPLAEEDAAWALERLAGQEPSEKR